MTSGPLQRTLRLAIDTNVLLLLVAYWRLEDSQGLTRARILRDIRGRDDHLSAEQFDGMWQRFRKAQRRVVTQHVVAEVWGPRGHRKQYRELIWPVAISLLKQFDVEELPCTTRELDANPEYRPILERIGPVDAGLLDTAEQQKLTLLTEDRELLEAAYRRFVAVKTPWNGSGNALLFSALFFRLAPFVPGFQTLLAALGALGDALHQLGTDQLDHGLLGAVALAGV